jgi:[CysO sulfur-carrier protein]-S-L-cysteine hydrolase
MPCQAVSIAREVLDAIVQHALAAMPRECCGMLVGAECRIDDCVPMANVDPHAFRYRLDPAAHIALNRRLRGTSRQVVGVYHSHPHGSAEPSATDIAEAAYPEFVHLIVSLADRARPDVRAYRIADGSAAPVALEPEAARPSS